MICLIYSGAGRDSNSKCSVYALAKKVAPLSHLALRSPPLLHIITISGCFLFQAFDSVHHPLGRSFSELVEAYTTTYGGVLVHPLLLPQAVAELRSLTTRLYNIVRVLFPALPPATSDMVVSGCDTE